MTTEPLRRRADGGSRRSRWLFYGALLPGAILLSSWQGWYWWSWATGPIQPDGSSLRLQVPAGASVQAVGQQLETVGLIRSRLAWTLWHRWQGLRGQAVGIQAGTYDLSTGASLADLARQLGEGKVVASQFTVPEGWSIRQMAAYFEAEEYFPQAQFLALALRPPSADLYAAYPWLPKGIDRLEGFLYPDTYQTPLGQVTPQAVVRQMLDRFQEVALPLYRQYAQAQGSKALSLEDWVGLASLVEKEAVVPQERGLIAGVFYNRLALGMNLASDPTVEYGLAIRQTADRPLTWKQVETHNPYNTYLNPGLPPTAIASPGLASFQAVAAPTATEFLYFVARYDGTHVFSRTLQEHQSAQDAIWDARERAARSKSPG